MYLDMQDSFLTFNRRTSSPVKTETPEGPRVLFTAIVPSEVSRLSEV